MKSALCSLYNFIKDDLQQCKSDVIVYVRSSGKYPYPALPRSVTEIQRGEGGGKGGNFRGGGGWLLEVFFPAALS